MTGDPDNLMDILNAAKTTAQIAEQTGFRGWLTGRLTRRREKERDYEAKARGVLRENALDTLRTLELTVEQLLLILGPDFQLSDLHEPDPTWRKHWLAGASKVAADDSDRHEWWARLLAGELQQPGAYSLRAMTVMDVLSREEAALFTRVASYVWHLGENELIVITPREESPLWTPGVDAALTLQEAGLVSLSDIGLVRTLRAGQRFRMKYRETEFVLEATKDERLRESNLALTQAGQQIFSLTTPKEIQGYVTEIIAEWSPYCNVQELPP